MTTPEKIAHILLEKRAVTLSTNPPYTWTSGIKSPIYCDNRLLISYPDARATVITEFSDLIKKQDLSFDVIAGTATAAIPWAAFLAYALQKPMVYVRPEPKGHGAGKQVEGRMEKGSRVLIVEDLISTGGSSLRSAQACEREYDAKTVAVIAIFTYEMEKSRQTFAAAGMSVHTLSNFHTLIEVAATEQYLTTEDKNKVMSWSQNPEAWWATLSS